MKKIFVAAVLCLVFLLPLSAGAEFSQQIHFLPFDWQQFSFNESNYWKKVPDSEVKGYSFPGFQFSARFYFVPLSKYFELGCGFNVGFDSPTYKTKNLPTKPDELGGFRFFGSFGPTLRFNLNDRNSISFTPMLSAGLVFLDDNESSSTDDKVSFFSSGSAVSLEFAYKRWLLNTAPVHLGLNAGFALDFPINYYLRADYYESANHASDDYIKYKADFGCAIKLFFGICINFGDRSFDKYREEDL